ncbi:MAG: hypothetical protein ACETVZ_06140 [Phycisphaerae bacterium]
MARKKRQATAKHSRKTRAREKSATVKHSHKTQAREKSSVPSERGPSEASLVSAKDEPEQGSDHPRLHEGKLAPAEGSRKPVPSRVEGAGSQAGVRQQPSQRVPAERGPKQVSARDEEVGSLKGDLSSPDVAGYAKAGAAGVGHRQAALDAATPLLTSIRHKRLSILQKILVSCIVLMVAVLIYVLLRAPATRPPKADKSLSTPTSSIVRRPSSDESRGTSDEGRAVATGQPTAGSGPTEGLSLRIAETFYLQKDFNKAYAAYNQLRQGLPPGQEDPIRDFLQLKMAFCMRNAGGFDQAAQIFRMVSQSRCPVVRTVANYHLSLLEMQKGQYLNARGRAYQTMALISALTFDWQWTLSLQRNCHFLIAESVTRHVLSLCDTDKDCPSELWTDTSEADPFINLSEAELRRLLNSGSEQLRGALLSPQIQSAAGTERQGGPAHWSVICNGASIEELLARFAAHADLDIQWAYPAPSSIPSTSLRTGVHPLSSIPGRDTPDEGQDMRDETQGTGIPQAVRDRAVSLYMSASTTKQFLTVAAGCVGLLARMDAPRFRGDKLAPAEAGETVEIFNPSDYTSLSQHIALLSQEAISLWRRFLLTFGDEKNAYGGANAHFALGLLQACAAGGPGRITDAIAEFKLVANRYPQTSLAPYALLASSKLKADLRDYLGAREDLKLLTEQYPDTEFSDQALLHLANATMKAGLLSEAARLYRKVYNLGFSLQSQRVSALGAGRCFYEQACRKPSTRAQAEGAGSQKDYEDAAKWLTQYINLAEDRTSRDFYLACFLLGKTYLAQDLHQQACNAFELALTGQLAVQEYVETVSALVKARLQQGHFVEALKLLDSAPASGAGLGQKESIEILLLKASVLRSMGLADEAIAVLGDKAEYVLDSQLKAKISFERAKCSIAKGNLESARKNLSEILVLVEPSATGGLAHEVGCELADVCLKLGQEPQAISICLQLLDSEPQAPIKQRTLNLLATAYTQQKNYDQAALALLGQPNQNTKFSRRQHGDGTDNTQGSRQAIPNRAKHDLSP